MKEKAITREQLSSLKMLHQRKNREDSGMFLIEGNHLVEEALKEHATVLKIVVTERFAGASRNSYLLSSAYKAGIPLFSVNEKVMDTLSQTDSPQGILAVIKKQAWDTEKVIHSSDLILIACGLQDPGNLGTIIRTADAGDVSALITAENTVDVYNAKVIRASMGSIFRVPVILSDDISRSVLSLKANGFQIIAASADSSTSYLDINYPGRTAIIIGQEAAGISEELLGISDKKVSIPIYGRAESLNAAIAAAILIYEVRRQRGK